MSNMHTVSRPFTREQLAADYASGMTQVEIADKYGSTQKVVWRAMRSWGITARVAAKREQRGSKNSSWKGDSATYAALHRRVEAQRGRPKRCEDCGKTRGRFEWANISGRYSDVMDYKRLCVSCHHRLDGTVQNFPEMRTEHYSPRFARRSLG